MRDSLKYYSHKIWELLRAMGPAQKFLVIALILGLVFVVKTPPLWGGDETSHYARAYQISQGNLVSDKLPYPYGGENYGGKVPKPVFDLIWHTNGDIENDRNITSYGTQRIDDISSYERYTHQKLGQATEDYFFPNTAAYSPIAYIPSAIGLGISQLLQVNVGQSIFLARLLGLLFYIGCVFWALKALEKHKFAWVVFAVALLPTALFQASIISADLMANGLAILLTSLVMKSFFEKKLGTYELAAIMASAIALPIIKPTYIFLSLFMFLIPGTVLKKRWKMKPTVIKLIVIFIGVAALTAWTLMTIEVSDEIRRMGIGPRWVYIDPKGQVEFILGHPWAPIAVFFRSILLTDNNYISGFFGQFGFDYVQVPMVSILSSLLAILIAIGFSNRPATSLRTALMALLILAAGVASVFGTLYITFSNVAQPIIEGVQGRYFMPFALLLCAIVVLFNTRFKLESGPQNMAWLTNAVAALCCVSLVFAALKFFYVMLG